VSCNPSKIVIAANQLSLREPNTLAGTLDETLSFSFSAANARHEVDFAMPRFTSAVPNFS